MIDHQIWRYPIFRQTHLNCQNDNSNELGLSEDVVYPPKMWMIINYNDNKPSFG